MVLLLYSAIISISSLLRKNLRKKYEVKLNSFSFGFYLSFFLLFLIPYFNNFNEFLQKIYLISFLTFMVLMAVFGSRKNFKNIATSSYQFSLGYLLPPLNYLSNILPLIFTLTFSLNNFGLLKSRELWNNFNGNSKLLYVIALLPIIGLLLSYLLQDILSLSLIFMAYLQSYLIFKLISDFTWFKREGDIAFFILGILPQILFFLI